MLFRKRKNKLYTELEIKLQRLHESIYSEDLTKEEKEKKYVYGAILAANRYWRELAERFKKRSEKIGE